MLKEKNSIYYPPLKISADKQIGLEEKVRSCCFKNSRAISGEVTGMTWMPPSRMQMISAFISSINLFIHRNVGLFFRNSGRLPTIGNALGPGGSGRVLVLLLLFLWYLMSAVMNRVKRKIKEKQKKANERPMILGMLYGELRLLLRM